MNLGWLSHPFCENADVEEAGKAEEEIYRREQPWWRAHKKVMMSSRAREKGGGLRRQRWQGMAARPAWPVWPSDR